MSFIVNLTIMLVAVVMTHMNSSAPSETNINNDHGISAIPFFRRVGYDDPYCNSSMYGCSTSRLKYAEILSAFYGRTNLSHDIPVIRHDNTKFVYTHSNEHHIDMKLFSYSNYDGVIADDLNPRVQGGTPQVQGNRFNYDDRPSSLDVTAAEHPDGRQRDPMSSVQHHASISPL